MLHFMDTDTVKELKTVSLLSGQHGMGFVGRVQLKLKLHTQRLTFSALKLGKIGVNVIFHKSLDC